MKRTQKDRSLSAYEQILRDPNRPKDLKLMASVRLINRVMKRRLRSIRQVTPRKVEINTSSFRWDRYNDNLRNKIANSNPGF